MRTDPDTIRSFLVQVRDRAMQMMENGAFIQKELPSLRMPDALRQKLDALCENLIGTKHDLIDEIFEIGGLLDDSPESPAIEQGIKRRVYWAVTSPAATPAAASSSCASALPLPRPWPE